jgi:hypothetical protein
MPAAIAEATLKAYERSDLSTRAWQRLEQHPHFRGRLHGLQIEQQGQTLCLSGRLPTFYLKQLVQETLRHVPGVERVFNGISVVSPFGVSSEP